MPNPNSSNVLVAKPLVTGGVLVAPKGTALPTDVSTALNAAFLAVGYVTDDGLTKTDSIDSDTVRAWGGVIIATPQTGKTATFQFTLAEHFAAIGHQLVFGDSAVTTTAATANAGTRLKIAADAYSVPPRRSYAFEMVAGTARDRIIVPDAQVTDLGDVSYADGDITARELTLTAFADNAGNYYYEFTDDGVKTGA